MARTNYGVPYKGSKNMIAEWVVSHVPECGTFFDVFAGGCAVTDCILRKGQAKHAVANDLDPMPVKCFEMAVRGEFADEDRWISREAFFMLKDTDPYVRFCFSFGNNAKCYMYSTTIEPYKRAIHYVLFHDYWDDFDRLCPEVCDACHAALDGITDRKERRINFNQAFTNRIKELSGDNWFAPIVQNNPLYRTVKTKNPKRDFSAGDGSQSLEGMTRLQSLQNLERLERLQNLEKLESIQSLENLERLERLQSLESLQSLQSLESLERLENLERLERLQNLESLQSLERLQNLESLERLQSIEPSLETSNLDYRALTERILATDNSFVYCDPPYRGTQGYGEFDYDAFLNWALEIGKKRPVLISEYAIDHDGFIEVDSKLKLSSFSGNGSKTVYEKLYTVKEGLYLTQ